MQKLKAGLMKQPFRPAAQMPPCKPVTEQSEGHPEWLIHEDWALLQVGRLHELINEESAELSVCMPDKGRFSLQNHSAVSKVRV